MNHNDDRNAREGDRVEGGEGVMEDDAAIDDNNGEQNRVQEVEGGEEFSTSITASHVRLNSSSQAEIGAQQQQDDVDDDDDDDDASIAAQESRSEQLDHHSYLPGPSHPLLNSSSLSYPPEDSSHQDDRASTCRASTSSLPATHNDLSPLIMDELPILELPGLVLFPGCSIPIRLQNRSWIQHLGRHIDASRRVGSHGFGQTVRLGILTQQQQEEESIFAVHHQPARRRFSALRRGVRNSQQQRRISRILQQELFGNMEDINDSNSSDDDDNNTDDDDDERGGHRSSSNATRRNLHPFVGRVGTIATITYTHGDAVLDENGGNNSNSNININNNARSSGVWQQHAENQTELILQAVGTERFRIHSYLEIQSFAEVQVFQVEKFYQDSNPLSCPLASWTGIPRRLSVDPALVDSDGKDCKLESSSSHDNLSSKSSPTERTRRPSSSQHQQDKSHSTQYFVSHQESLIRQLSAVTPIPWKALQQVWPWRLVGNMVKSIQSHSISQRKRVRRSNDDREGGMTADDHNQEHQSPGSLLSSLAELLQNKETGSLIDHPTKFSFWMAANMPLSVEEKLVLLQVPSTVERLKLLQKHLGRYTKASFAVCCKSCRIELSNVDRVFTVGGAEGTTGNFVNEHGFIHQVVTLREINEEEVVCVGPASTENSYFPGYSWTVTYCQRCGTLLGWKFHWVGDAGRARRTPEKNRPDSFFGFMSSSLVTELEE